MIITEKRPRSGFSNDISARKSGTVKTFLAGGYYVQSGEEFSPSSENWRKSEGVTSFWWIEDGLIGRCGGFWAV